MSQNIYFKESRTIAILVVATALFFSQACKTDKNQVSESSMESLPEIGIEMNTGMWHTNMGMIKELVVVEEQSKMEEPEADVAVNISSESGIVVEPPVDAGLYTFSVNYTDQITHENFVGHDVILVKFNTDANEEVLEDWMDWRDPEGLIEPAPEGFVFLGGVNDMPAGGKGCFTAGLEPGKYALISEVPDASEKGPLKTFEIL